MSGDRMGDTRFGMISKKINTVLYSFFAWQIIVYGLLILQNKIL